MEERQKKLERLCLKKHEYQSLLLAKVYFVFLNEHFFFILKYAYMQSNFELDMVLNM